MQEKHLNHCSQELGTGLIKPSCHFCIRQKYPWPLCPPSTQQEEGGSLLQVEIAGSSPQSLDELSPGGSSCDFLAFTHAASALGDKQPHAMHPYALNF